MDDLKTFISRDRQAVRLIKGKWVMTIRAAEAPRWRDFYRRLWARGSKDPKQPGPYARFYAQSVEAMERVCKELEA